LSHQEPDPEPLGPAGGRPHGHQGCGGDEHRRRESKSTQPDQQRQDGPASPAVTRGRPTRRSGSRFLARRGGDHAAVRIDVCVSSMSVGVASTTRSTRTGPGW
jgi:hypothetical protein